jgi:hypothetical protein
MTLIVDIQIPRITIACIRERLVAARAGGVQ